MMLENYIKFGVSLTCSGWSCYLFEQKVHFLFFRSPSPLPSLRAREPVRIPGLIELRIAGFFFSNSYICQGLLTTCLDYLMILGECGSGFPVIFLPLLGLCCPCLSNCALGMGKQSKITGSKLLLLLRQMELSFCCVLQPWHLVRDLQLVRRIFDLHFLCTSFSWNTFLNLQLRVFFKETHFPLAYITYQFKVHSWILCV